MIFFYTLVLIFLVPLLTFHIDYTKLKIQNEQNTKVFLFIVFYSLVFFILLATTVQHCLLPFISGV